MPKREKPLDTSKYLIDTRTPSNPQGRPGITFRRIENSPEYKKLLDKEAKGARVTNNPRIDNRIAEQSSCFHDAEMFTDPLTIVWTADFTGMIEVATEEDAKFVLDMLRKIDKDVDISPYGKQFETEYVEGHV